MEKTVPYYVLLSHHDHANHAQLIRPGKGISRTKRQRVEYCLPPNSKCPARKELLASDVLRRLYRTYLFHNERQDECPPAGIQDQSLRCRRRMNLPTAWRLNDRPCHFAEFYLQTFFRKTSFQWNKIESVTTF